MKVESRFELLFGPYEPPRIPRKRRLLCELRGYLKVGTYSNALIPWPRRYQTNSIILCGDLVRAVEMESVDAVAYHWGVCRSVVQTWRRALGVPEMNPGTRQLREKVCKQFTREARHRATLRANDPAAVVKSELPLHERAHPLVRRATSQLMKDRFARTGRHLRLDLRLWTAKEERFLGTAPDDQIARKLERTQDAVRARRIQLGIRAWKYRYERPWTPEEEALLGLIPDLELARELKRPFTAVQARRELRGLRPANPMRHLYTPEEDALLGTLPDEEAARRIGVSVRAVVGHRVSLGIRIYNPRLHHWTPREDRLLGKAPDRKVAGRLGVSIASVSQRRRRLGIRMPPKEREWRAEELRLVGRMPDQQVSRLLNRSNWAVRVKRRELGIRFPNPRCGKWSAKEIALLGKVSDPEITRRTGHSLPSVRWARASRGIPARSQARG